MTEKPAVKKRRQFRKAIKSSEFLNTGSDNPHYEKQIRVKKFKPTGPEKKKHQTFQSFSKRTQRTQVTQILKMP